MAHIACATAADAIQLHDLQCRIEDSLRRTALRRQANAQAVESRPAQEAQEDDTEHPGDAGLRAMIEQSTPMQDDGERAARRGLLSHLTHLIQSWSRAQILSCCGYDVPLERAALLLLSGSEPTGLDESGIDIDACAVFPNLITRDAFFLAMREHLSQDPTVSNIQLLDQAKVPMIGFEVTCAGGHKVDVDLLVAVINVTPLPTDFDVHSEAAILSCVDEASELSLNGPRTTEALLRSLPSRCSRRVFLDVLRAVRLWARRRELYSNKAGFLGGINLSLLAAHAVRQYPDAPALEVLERFFCLYKEWAWPTPVRLCEPRPCAQPAARTGHPLAEWTEPTHSSSGVAQGAGTGRRGGTRAPVMPILTPAFPSGNSAPLVTPTSLGIIKEEMALAHEQVRRFARTAPAPHSSNENRARPRATPTPYIPSSGVSSRRAFWKRGRAPLEEPGL